MIQAMQAMGLANLNPEQLSSHPALASLSSLQSMQSLQNILGMIPASGQVPLPVSMPEDLVTAGHIEAVSITQGFPQGVVQGLAHVSAQGMPQQITQGIARQPSLVQAPGGRPSQSNQSFGQVNCLRSCYSHACHLKFNAPCLYFGYVDDGEEHLRNGHLHLPFGQINVGKSTHHFFSVQDKWSIQPVSFARIALMLY